ncbi:MAG: DUF6188 family protein [Burkholderiaceae bacterium]
MSTVPPIIQAVHGCVVTRLTVDDSFTLSLCGIDREVVLRIDGSGVLRSADGEQQIDPDRDPTSAAAMLKLMNRHVDSVRLDDDGGLTLECGDVSLQLLPSDHTLSWSMQGPDGTRASCLAEGRVVWE